MLYLAQEPEINTSCAILILSLNPNPNILSLKCHTIRIALDIPCPTVVDRSSSSFVYIILLCFNCSLSCAENTDLFVSSAVKRVTVLDIIHNLIQFSYQDRHSGVPQ